MKLRSIAGILLLLPAANVAAQSAGTPQQRNAGQIDLPNYNGDHWMAVSADDGSTVLSHNLSGALCPDTFRELQLTNVRSYAPDGTDVSCSYTKGAGETQTTLTTYFFRKADVTGPIAHQQAGNAIIQRGETTALTVSFNEDHSARCRQAAAPVVGEQVRLRQHTADDDASQFSFDMGVAIFDFTTESGVEARSALMTYELGGWIIKMRLTTPAGDGDKGYAYACNYSGLAAAGTARILDLEEAS